MAPEAFFEKKVYGNCIFRTKVRIFAALKRVKMRARIIYMLFVLLLAITWSAEDVTPCKATHRDVCPTTHLCTSITPIQSVPLYLRMSAEVNVFTCTMEPVSTISMQKALPRYRSDTDNLGAEQNLHRSPPRLRRENFPHVGLLCLLAGAHPDLIIYGQPSGRPAHSPRLGYPPTGGAADRIRTITS